MLWEGYQYREGTAGETFKIGYSEYLRHNIIKEGSSLDIFPKFFNFSD